MYASRMLLNPDIREAAELRSKMSVGSIQLSPCNSVVLGPPKMSIEDEYLRQYPKMTIENVNNNPEGSKSVEYPAEFKSLVGRKLLFKIANTSVSSRQDSGVYRVRGICEDANIIAMYELPGVDISPNKAGSITPANLLGSGEELAFTPVSLADDCTPCEDSRVFNKRAISEMYGSSNSPPELSSFFPLISVDDYDESYVYDFGVDESAYLSYTQSFIDGRGGGFFHCEESCI
ncbi:hypothetical protein RIF29_25499 [Crotalaria pallida]|uniref:Uncharacterized protein n=1 Tax=Crotalaria pallida TaxID=3830 RepID=A0AAN9HZV1_CROPI